MIYLFLYIAVAISFYVMLILDILSLTSIRSSQSGKIRKKIDEDVEFMNDCKQHFYIWPYAIYKIINRKNVTK